jgi:hypothetical protein
MLFMFLMLEIERKIQIIKLKFWLKVCFNFSSTYITCSSMSNVAWCVAEISTKINHKRTLRHQIWVRSARVESGERWQTHFHSACSWIKESFTVWNVLSAGRTSAISSNKQRLHNCFTYLCLFFFFFIRPASLTVCCVCVLQLKSSLSCKYTNVENRYVHICKHKLNEKLA